MTLLTDHLLDSLIVLRKRPAAYNLPLRVSLPLPLVLINFSTHVRYFRPLVFAARGTRTLATCLLLDNTRPYIHARAFCRTFPVTFSLNFIRFLLSFLSVAKLVLELSYS